MGKNKDKKKVSGAVKTAAKTEKKQEAKRKKEIANLGEEDIETIVAGIEREEAKRQAVIETVIAPPSPRVSATLVPHPTNTSELILFGGEHHDGKKTYVYNGLYVYNTAKGEWRVIKAPGAPPPRSAHQAVAIPSNKGELWIFGGEFTSPTELQFYHYKDLWLFSLAERKWEKVDAPGGPSPRSGHRMASLRRVLVLFGGYHDNGRAYKYHSDIHAFCTDTRMWIKIKPSGIGPCARSACLFMPAGPDMLMVYGGYSRVRDGKVDHGQTHGDLFRLSAVSKETGAVNKNTPSGAVAKNPSGAALPGQSAKEKEVSYKWESLKGGVSRPSPPRTSFSCCVAPGNKAYVFGGIQDMEETEELLTGELYDTLHCLELDTGTWREASMRTQKSEKAGKSSESQGNDEDEAMDTAETVTEAVTTVVDDGIFKMTVAAAKPSTRMSIGDCNSTVGAREGPSPRMNAMMAVQKSTLYLYGGLIEKGEKQFTLSDMFSLDLHKMDGWKTITSQSGLPEWLGSDSEDDGEDNGDESDSEESGSQQSDTD